MDTKHIDTTEDAQVDDDLLRWFDTQHLLRTLVLADDAEQITEVVRAPLLLLSARPEDARNAPNPDALGYPEKRLSEMTLDNFHVFILRWATRAVDAGIARCFACDETLRNDDLDAPWDGIFTSEDLVAWLFIHFDCKRRLSRDLKGRSPFDLHPRPPETFDVSRE